MRRLVVPLLAVAALFAVVAGVRELRVPPRETFRLVNVTGAIRVESWSGAAVALDGTFRGRIAAGEREMTILGVLPGTHWLRVAVPHLQAWVQEVQLTQGETASVTVQSFGPPIMTRQFESDPTSEPSRTYGTLHLGTSPSDVFMDSVTLDWQGRTKTRRWVVATNIPPGRHRITLRTSRLRRVIEFRVFGGEVATRTIDLMSGGPILPERWPNSWADTGWEDWKPDAAVQKPVDSEFQGTLAISTNADASLAVTCDRSRRIWLWSADRKPVRRLIARDGDVAAAVAISLNGNRIAASDWFHRVWIHDIALEKRLSTFEDARGAISSVVLDPAGELVAAADSAGYVHVWEVDSGKLLWGRKTGARNADHLAVSADGRMLAIASDGERPVQTCDFRTGDGMRSFGDDAFAAVRVAISVDPPILAAIRFNGDLKSWNWKTGDEVLLTRHGVEDLNPKGLIGRWSLAASRNGIFVFGASSGLRVYGPRDSDVLIPSIEEIAGAVALTLSGDGRRILWVDIRGGSPYPEDD